jgi:hypothetical protein
LPSSPWRPIGAPANSCPRLPLTERPSGDQNPICSLSPNQLGSSPFPLAFRFTAALCAFPTSCSTSLLRPGPSHLAAPLCCAAACSGAPYPAASSRSSARTPTPIYPTVSRVTPRVPSPLTTRAAPSTDTDDDTEQEPAPEPSRTTTFSKIGDRAPGVPRRREPEGGKQGINADAVNLTCLPTPPRHGPTLLPASP